MPYPTMPFGRYRGESLRRVPAEYLLWVLHGVAGLDPLLRKAVVSELLARVDRSAGRMVDRERPGATDAA